MHRSQGLGRLFYRLAVLCLAAGTVVLTSDIHAEPVKGAMRVAAGKTKLVFVVAGFDTECRSTTLPVVSVDAPAAKGKVVLKAGETTTVQYSLSGRCIGAKVQGVAIYYVAADDAVGADAFSISARMPTGEIATRMFNLHIVD
ncbi:MAG TPA: hypothetical protein PK264_16510 [Hyphomicrobiaceae bacterium]|nr:hypothetical protein [Hyphomicrobiaceae bacterium]